MNTIIFFDFPQNLIDFSPEKNQIPNLDNLPKHLLVKIILNTNSNETIKAMALISKQVFNVIYGDFDKFARILWQPQLNKLKNRRMNEWGLKDPKNAHELFGCLNISTIIKENFFDGTFSFKEMMTRTRKEDENYFYYKNGDFKKESIKFINNLFINHLINDDSYQVFSSSSQSNEIMTGYKISKAWLSDKFVCEKKTLEALKTLNESFALLKINKKRSDYLKWGLTSFQSINVEKLKNLKKDIEKNFNEKIEEIDSEKIKIYIEKIKQIDSEKIKYYDVLIEKIEKIKSDIHLIELMAQENIEGIDNEKFKEIIKKNIEKANKEFETCRVETIEKANEIAKLMFPGIGKKGKGLLCTALKYNIPFDGLKILIEKAAAPINRTFLDKYCKYHFPSQEEYKFFIEHGVAGVDILMVAIKTKKLSNVKTCIDYGAKEYINHKNNKGLTPLAFAESLRCSIKMQEYLKKLQKSDLDTF